MRIAYERTKKLFGEKSFQTFLSNRLPAPPFYVGLFNNNITFYTKVPGISGSIGATWVSSNEVVMDLKQIEELLKQFDDSLSEFERAMLE